MSTANASHGAMQVKHRACQPPDAGSTASGHDLVVQNANCIVRSTRPRAVPVASPEGGTLRALERRLASATMAELRPPSRWPAADPAGASAAVPPLAQTVRVEGKLIGLFSFDIGYEIDLAKARALTHRGETSDLERRRAAPASLTYATPPLRVPLGVRSVQ